MIPDHYKDPEYLEYLLKYANQRDHILSSKQSALTTCVRHKDKQILYSISKKYGILWDTYESCAFVFGDTSTERISFPRKRMKKLYWKIAELPIRELITV